MEPTTVTAIKAAQMVAQERYAMSSLLDRLRRFMFAYPTTDDEAMPLHRVSWRDEIHDGPAKTILDAIKSNPVLWQGALPPEVVIVPRKMLEVAGVSSAVIDGMAMHGADAVYTAAARHAHFLQNSDDRITHYSNADGWFYVCEDGTEVGPFESEWQMFKYVEDRDINEET